MLSQTSGYSSNRRKAKKGNTLAEYALPIALVVITTGVVASIFNIKGALPKYLAKASGGSVSGGQIQSNAMGQGATGALGTGSQAGNASVITYNGSSAGAYFMGSAPAELVGGDGNGGYAQSIKLPAALAGMGSGSQDQNSLHYVPAVDKSVGTGQAMSTSEALAKGLVSQKYADYMRVNISAAQHPEEVTQAGGQLGLDMGNGARQDQISSCAGGGSCDLQNIQQDVKTEAASIQGSANPAVKSFAMAQKMERMDGTAPDQNSTGFGTLNPQGYQNFLTGTMEAQMQADLLNYATSHGMGASTTTP